MNSIAVNLGNVQKVLIIEDDADIARLLKANLVSIGYVVTVCSDGIEGIYSARVGHYDLAIIDIMLPGIDGMEICKTLRSNNNKMPIIIVSSKSDELDKVLALELGADDYLTKPFGVRELQSRVRSLARRSQWAISKSNEKIESTQLAFGDVEIDIRGRTVLKSNQELELTSKEFDLLVVLASNPGRVYSRAELLSLVWRYDYEGYEHTVNSHINRLRNKIELDPSTPRYLQTVWGVGYKLVVS